MESEVRKTGIGVVGDRPWGTHLCLFYETKEDLLEIVVPYLKDGFESREYCIWVIPDFLTSKMPARRCARSRPALAAYATIRTSSTLSRQRWRGSRLASRREAHRRATRTF